MRTRWILILAIVAPAAAAPKPLTAKELSKVDAGTTSLFVDLDDKNVNRLSRFNKLRELALTGPYDSNL